jgi:Retrotransposon gag protein/Zinc knuckle
MPPKKTTPIGAGDSSSTPSQPTRGNVNDPSTVMQSDDDQGNEEEEEESDENEEKTILQRTNMEMMKVITEMRKELENLKKKVERQETSAATTSYSLVAASSPPVSSTPIQSSLPSSVLSSNAAVQQPIRAMTGTAVDSAVQQPIRAMTGTAVDSAVQQRINAMTGTAVDSAVQQRINAMTGTAVDSVVQQRINAMTGTTANDSSSVYKSKFVEVDVDGYQPTKLKKVDASNREILTTWLYEMEIYNQMRRVPTTDVEEYLRIATGNVDKSMNVFLKGLINEVCPNGEALPWANWEQMGKAIMKKFLPVSNEAMVFGELMRLEQSSSQSINEYLTRAQELMLQSGDFVRDEEQLVTTLHAKMDVGRYFKSHHELMIWMEEQREKKVNITMDGFMMKALKCELSEKPAEAKAASRRVNNVKTTANSQSSSSSSNNDNTNNSTPSDIPSIIAAVMEKMANDKKCGKCGDSGHSQWECTSGKETRTCFRCRKVGHLANKCPKPAPSPPRTDAKPKNA